ncbi:hypothetical protein [Tomitella biformata]|nr:hypothetical protein [Tomitella biformata]
MINPQHIQGSLVIDFGSLASALGLGSAGPLVSFGSAGSLQFSSVGGS